MRQIAVEHFIKIKDLRSAVNKSEHDYAEIILKLSMLEKSVERDLRICISLELYNYSHTFSVRLISDVSYMVKSLILYKFSNFFYESSLVYLIRDLGKHYLSLSLSGLFKLIL